MPAIKRFTLRIPRSLYDSIDKVQATLNQRSKNELILYLLGCFIPDFYPDRLVRVLLLIFGWDKLDTLTARISTYAEKRKCPNCKSKNIKANALSTMGTCGYCGYTWGGLS